MDKSETGTVENSFLESENKNILFSMKSIM